MQIFLLLAATSIIILVIEAAWVPGSLPNSFAAIYIKSEGFYRVPVRGTQFFYMTPWDARVVEFCSLGHALNMSCIEYFCSPTATATTNAKNHTMMQNYCQYCEYGTRSKQQFEQFHQMVQNNECPRFAPWFGNFSCGSAENRVWMYERAYNLTVPPNLCFCAASDKLAASCDAMSAFFDDFFHQGLFIFAIGYALLMILLITVLIIVPECGLKCQQRYTSRKELCFSFFSIRMQSIYLLLLCHVLYIIDNAIELVYFSSLYETMISWMPNAAVYIFSIMFLFMSYATMLILWSSVYTKAQEGVIDQGLDRKHIIATAIFYTLIGVSMFTAFLVLVILGRTPLYLISYAIAITVAVCFFVVFPMGFTIYGCLILSFKSKFNQVNIKITAFMVLTNILFIALILACIPTLIPFVLGWDVLGRVFASFRYIVTFSPPIVLTPPMIFILFVSRRFAAFYTCCHQNSNAIKQQMPEQTENKT